SFPPADLRSFLVCCAGEWLALRSLFAPEEEAAAAAGAAEEAEAGEEGETWHSAERGELVVTYLPPEREDEPGGLAITPPVVRGRPLVTRHLIFSAGGRFRGAPAAGGDSPEEEGSWQLRADGTLELTVHGEEAVVRERIWFTKPNLRLRSSMEQRHDGRPGQASFSSEIRRVRPPAERPGPAAP
ncbi:MAG: phycobiliprotein lyase, partial [Synechococcaceae cyanobacterium]|nr:phycobiliprotein lyase [Synechococcaceae cyanobacterium]